MLRWVEWNLFAWTFFFTLFSWVLIKYNCDHRPTDDEGWQEVGTYWSDLSPEEGMSLYLLDLGYLQVNSKKVPLPLGGRCQDAQCSYCSTGWISALVIPWARCPCTLTSLHNCIVLSSGLCLSSLHMSDSMELTTSCGQSIPPLSEQLWLWQVLLNTKKKCFPVTSTHWS